MTLIIKNETRKKYIINGQIVGWGDCFQVPEAKDFKTLVVEEYQPQEQWYRHHYWQDNPHKKQWDNVQVLSPSCWKDFKACLQGSQKIISVDQPCSKPGGE